MKMAKNLQDFFWIWKKSRYSKPNTFTKNRWKRSKRSKRKAVKVASVLWRVILLKKINSNEVVDHYSKDVSLSNLTKEQSEQCKGQIIENEFKHVLGNMEGNKTPENDNVLVWTQNPIVITLSKNFVWRITHFSKKQLLNLKKRQR